MYIVRPGVEFIAENGEGPGEETGCIVPASGWRPAEGGKKLPPSQGEQAVQLA